MASNGQHIVDLCSPERTPPRYRMDGEAIEILSSDDGSSGVKAAKENIGNDKKKFKRIKHLNHALFLPFTRIPNSHTKIKEENEEEKKEEEDEDDICVLGSIGTNVLLDMPHARGDCVQVPFAQAPREFCAKCFCFVCDIPASVCQSWEKHYVAMRNDKKWQDERDRARGGRERGMRSKSKTGEVPDSCLS